MKQINILRAQKRSGRNRGVACREIGTRTLPKLCRRNLNYSSRWEKRRSKSPYVLPPVQWIIEILFRIRIRGSVPLTYGSGSCFFSLVADKVPTKNKFFFEVFLLLFFEGTFTSVFIDKKSKRSHRIVEIKVLLFFFQLVDVSYPDPYKIVTDPDGPKTYGSYESGSQHRLPLSD